MNATSGAVLDGGGLDEAAPDDSAAGKRPSRRERLIAQWAHRLRPRFTDGNAVTLYQGGREFFPVLEHEISQAKREIFMETYLFHDDATGWAIARALAAAAQRGVRVHLMVDGYGGGKLSADQAQLMRDAGVRVEIFRAEGSPWALSRRRLRRLHRKITVVDARVAFVGGINIVDDFEDPNHGKLPGARLDYSTRLEGPILGQIHWAVHRHFWSTALVNRAFKRAGRSPSERFWERARLPEPDPAHVAPVGDVRAMLVLRDNIRFRHTIERRYLWAIRRARREIIIANAYFLPGVRFRRALVAAARRGVRVRLLLQGRIEYALQHHASQALYDELLRAGVEIIEYHTSFLHAKVAVIDDTCTVGSSNIDPFSLLLARESNVVFDDARVAAQLKARLEAAIAEGGQPVQLRHIERRAWPVRVANWCSFVLLRIAVSLTGVAGRY